MKKQKIVNSDPSINFRLPETLKTEILQQAQLQNKTVSNYLRELLQSYYNGVLYEEEIAFYEEQAFLNSTDFLQLIVWMYKKIKENRYTPEDQRNQDRFIATLKITKEHMPEDLVEEFDKVLMDVIKVKNDKRDYKSYDFCRISSLNHLAFKYEKWENYLLGLDRSNTIVIKV